MRCATQWQCYVYGSKWYNIQKHYMQIVHTHGSALTHCCSRFDCTKGLVLSCNQCSFCSYRFLWYRYFFVLSKCWFMIFNNTNNKNTPFTTVIICFIDNKTEIKNLPPNRAQHKIKSRKQAEAIASISIIFNKPNHHRYRPTIKMMELVWQVHLLPDSFASFCVFTVSWRFAHNFNCVCIV